MCANTLNGNKESMRILIIEDETTAARGLRDLILRLRPEVDICDILSSVNEAVSWFHSQEKLDLAFFDIQLKDGLSFEIFEQVKVPCPVIFCTAYDQYAVQAFQVNGIDYLLKPIEEKALLRSLSKYESLKATFSLIDLEELRALQKEYLSESNFKERFLAKAGKKLFHVNRKDIAYIYTANKVVYVVTQAGRKLQLDQNLEQLEQQLSKAEFFRVNRQFIVGIGSIDSVENDYGTHYLNLNPEHEELVSVSKYRLEAFKRWLNGAY